MALNAHVWQSVGQVRLAEVCVRGRGRLECLVLLDEYVEELSSCLNLRGGNKFIFFHNYPIIEAYDDEKVFSCLCIIPAREVWEMNTPNSGRES